MVCNIIFFYFWGEGVVQLVTSINGLQYIYISWGGGEGEGSMDLKVLFPLIFLIIYLEQNNMMLYLKFNIIKWNIILYVYIFSMCLCKRAGQYSNSILMGPGQYYVFFWILSDLVLDIQYKKKHVV